MTVIASLLFVLFCLPILVLFQAWLLRLAARLVSGHRVGWVRAIVATTCASLVQGCITGVVAGGDAGCSGVSAGFILWSAAIALLTDLSFGQALVVGLVMAVLQWLISLVLLAAGLSALLASLAIAL